VKRYPWILAVVLVSFLWPLLAYPEERGTDPYKIHAERLKQTLESVLFTFSPTTQKHYATRLYRMTGDTRYIYPITFDLLALLRKLHHDQLGSHDPSYIQQRTDEIINHEFILGATNPETRRAALVRGGDVAFYLNLAKLLNTLREYDLLGAKVFPEAGKMLEALRQQKGKLATFLLDQKLMKTAGAQLVNYAYYLFRLNVVDIRQRYLEGLEQALMRGKADTELSDPEYIEKIYGMTHVILAASDYYQEPVERKDFTWIFDHFEKNIEAILARTKPDVYAEVGISFLLANDRENPALRRIRDAIVADIHPQKGIILSVKGSSDLNSGEHRNVLAIMLLDWPWMVFRGPSLRSMSQLQRLLPRQERE
jgi:hypothetical protein